MPLIPGTSIGPYVIAEKIGAGGMGEVFRAQDVNLGRAAAIKVLPASLAGDPERLARFEREAQTLASLNHPNIAQVFGLEKGSGDFRAIAMEFVDGPTLAERIAGPMPLDEAIPIALQIAEALESAHDHGIVHRDLKPANIKVRHDGTVKVLDFGLAKALDRLESDGFSRRSADAEASALQTITSPAITRAGVILGTAAYMSPEQAKGRVVDRRADIWAFGCVLFEMLSGKRAFAGGDVSELMVSILRDDPSWSALPAGTPPQIKSLLQRCLQKDVRKRLPHIGVARLELAEPAAPAAAATSFTYRVTPVHLVAIAIICIALAMPAGFMLRSRRAAAAEAPLRLRVEVGIDRPITFTSSVTMAPDGRTLAFAARFAADTSTPNLYVRSLDRLDAQMLPGTAGVQAPFFSPDGRWIAFFGDGLLKKIPVSGGSAITICEARQQRGGSWGDDNSIVFAASEGIMRVSAAGGNAAIIVKTESGPPPQWPHLLPGGRGVLYMTALNSDPDSGTIVAKALPDGEPRTVLRGGRFPRYLPSGHLAYFRSGALHAVPFDPVTLETRGEALPVVEGIAQTLLVGTPIVSVSANGTLAYQPGAAGINREGPIVWLTQSGTPAPLRTTTATWGLPRFSPDGRRLALTIFDGRQTDIWVYDWQRDILTRVTSEPSGDIAPVWTPDGSGLVFGSNRNGSVANLYWQRADGTGPARRLTEDPISQLPDAFHRDGRLIFHQGDPATNRQSLGVLRVESDGAGGMKASAPPTTLVGGPFLKSNARLSPDGRWISYAAFDTGSFEIYVQPLDGTGGRVQVSSGGGGLAMWSPTKNELYYVGSTEGIIMAVPYSIDGDAFVPEKPRPWSETRFLPTPPFGMYGPGLDLHPDGQRFAVAPVLSASTDTAARTGQLVLVFNLFDELRRLAPVP